MKVLGRKTQENEIFPVGMKLKIKVVKLQKNNKGARKNYDSSRHRLYYLNLEEQNKYFKKGFQQAICSLRNQTVYEMKCKTVLEKRRIASKWAIEAGL